MTRQQPLRSTDEKYGFQQPERYVFAAQKGLSEQTVQEISALKSEPAWMLEFRLHALKLFKKKPLPRWGGDLSTLDFDAIRYFIRPTEKQGRNWDEVPKEIKNTFERIGILEAEQKYLAGVGAQYESEVVYHSLQASLSKLGVIFTDMDSALRDYPDIVRRYFGTIIPAGDNKFAALNSAVWSGGSFVYVPKGVAVDLPLQAYFRINAQNMGQFERTLIIAEEGSSVHYVEGCTAPIYATDSLHSAVVEVVVRPRAHVRYTTIQNWSKNVYNLVTKRAAAYEEAHMEWVDGNLGSKLTMKYPSIYLLGRKARGETLSLAFAGDGQHQDAGAKMIHVAPETRSIITSKSVSQGRGRTSYRGLVDIHPGALHARTKVRCDALLLDPAARSDTYPTMDIHEPSATVEHEAVVSKIGGEQLLYLQSRGLTEEEASAMIVNGFLEPIVKELPMEYAVELNRLIQYEMEGSVG
ncbi:MAG: Fe-S cluster assembly protein SufB [Candidatus Kerfeldbacteria bacterium]|nr:Fe-S cluster assembly protein SufB [Candidatus Kerfeldbacteria bacterium]